MANGWGGPRPGSGRKPKTEAEKAVTGNAGHRKKASSPARVLAHPSSPTEAAAPVLPVVDESDAPNELNTAERNVWMKLAPLAMANGTLTPATSHAFVLLCKNVVLEATMAAAPLAVGTAAHTAVQKLLDARLLRFSLSACGKPMPDAQAATPAAPANPLAKFLGA